MLKRYLLFAHDQYYPSGGWGDFINSYDTIEDLKKECKLTLDEDNPFYIKYEVWHGHFINKSDYEWRSFDDIDIVDSEKGDILMSDEIKVLLT